MSEYLQRLTISLVGGQTIEVPFKAEKADRLNPQIDAFLKALGDPEKKDGNFLFQGQRVVLVRLRDVSAFDVVSLIRKETPKKKSAKDAAEA